MNISLPGGIMAIVLQCVCLCTGSSPNAREVETRLHTYYSRAILHECSVVLVLEIIPTSTDTTVLYKRLFSMREVL